MDLTPLSPRSWKRDRGKPGGIADQDEVFSISVIKGLSGQAVRISRLSAPYWIRSLSRHCRQARANHSRRAHDREWSGEGCKHERSPAPAVSPLPDQGASVTLYRPGASCPRNPQDVRPLFPLKPIELADCDRRHAPSGLRASRCDCHSLIRGEMRLQQLRRT